MPGLHGRHDGGGVVQDAPALQVLPRDARVSALEAVVSKTSNFFRHDLFAFVAQPQSGLVVVVGVPLPIPPHLARRMPCGLEFF